VRYDGAENVGGSLVFSIMGGLWLSQPCWTIGFSPSNADDRRHGPSCRNQWDTFGCLYGGGCKVKKPTLVRAAGRVKRSKARNLLERLQLYEQDVLRFMTNPVVPFTNNQGENDIRMTRYNRKYPAAFDPKTVLISFVVCAVICRHAGKTMCLPVRRLPFYSMGNCQISFFEWKSADSWVNYAE